MEVLKVKNSLIIVAAFMSLIKASPVLEDTGPSVLPESSSQEAAASISPNTQDTVVSPVSEDATAKTSPEETMYQFQCADLKFKDCLLDFFACNSKFDVYIKQSSYYLGDPNSSSKGLTREILNGMDEILDIMTNIDREISDNLERWYDSIDFYEYYLIYAHIISKLNQNKLETLYNTVKTSIKDEETKTLVFGYIDNMITRSYRLAYASLKNFNDNNGLSTDVFARNPFDLIIKTDDIKQSCPKIDVNVPASMSKDSLPANPDASLKSGDDDEVLKAGDIIGAAKPADDTQQPQGNVQGGTVNPLTANLPSSEPSDPILQATSDAENTDSSINNPFGL